MVDKFQGFSSKKLFEFDMKKKVGGGKIREEREKSQFGGGSKTTRTEKEIACFLFEGVVWGALSMLPAVLFWFLRPNLSKKAA